MQKALKILIYIIIGIILLTFILAILNVFLPSSKEERESVPQIQYIEIKGKHGNVKLHTGMIKDSVQILVGKPDEVDLYSTENTTYENWGYKIKNNYVSDLDIDFENGKVKAIRQN